jgi:5-methylcytosine-specific restriction enzyme A
MGFWPPHSCTILISTEAEMKLLFCNIGWMDFYQGLKGDSISRGGAYNKHSIGHEVCNFSDDNGSVYGYVQANSQIKLEKLGGSPSDEYIDGITVVWTAGPPDGGTAVVGWYVNATVFRHAQNIARPTPARKRDGALLYRLKASYADTFLIPAKERSTLIPRRVKGGIGQSNIWYADKPESQHTVKSILRLISGKTSPLLDIDEITSSFEGRPRLLAHIRKERDYQLVQSKKSKHMKEHGHLACEACGFDFEKVYGSLGYGFCEVHHLHPLSKADGIVKTTLNDLAIVCSNCHRMLHSSNPMPTISEMARSIRRLKNRSLKPRSRS